MADLLHKMADLSRFITFYVMNFKMFNNGDGLFNCRVSSCYELHQPIPSVRLSLDYYILVQSSL